MAVLRVTPGQFHVKLGLPGLVGPHPGTLGHFRHVTSELPGVPDGREPGEQSDCGTPPHSPPTVRCFT